MRQLSVRLLFALIFFTCDLFAQEKPEQEKTEKIQSLEIAFISRRLDLNPEDAQRFWPLYNEYKKEVRRIAREHRLRPEQDILEFEQQLIDVRKQYRARFTGVVGRERMNQFFKAEHEFRGVLLNRIKNHPGRNENSPRNREKRLRN